MDFHAQLVTALLCLAGIGYVIYLTVHEKLSEGWCLFWLVLFALALVLVCVSPILLWVTALLGARYPVSALSLVAIFLLLLLGIQSNRQASKHSRDVVAIVRELAWLRLEVQHLRAQVARREDGVTTPHHP